MSLYSELQKVQSEEDVKDAYIKAAKRMKVLSQISP